MWPRLLATIRSLDKTLLVAVFILLAFGFAAIFSVEFSRGGQDFTFVHKQVLATFLGVAVLVALASTNASALRHYAVVLYVVGVLLLLGVFVFGRTLNGSTGWYVIPGFAFQPIEFMKLALVVALARYFGEHARRRFGWDDVLKSLALALIPAALAAFQPDLGGAALLLGTWCVMAFFAGIRPLQAVSMLFAIVLVAFVGWTFLFAPYQRERIATFLDPSIDPLARGYNVTQAKIAIGAGGLFGSGLGEGSQSQLRFLPESQTDFVFAVIAEELGFASIVVLLSAFVVLLYRTLVLARQSRDTFSGFLALGAFAALATQTVVHIGANVSLLPATGVALPFVSYGGSSLVVSFVFLGVVESVAVRLRPGDRAENAVYSRRL